MIAATLIIALILFLKNKKRKPNILKYVVICAACIGFSLSVDFVFDNVFKQHHRDRFNIVLGKEVDLRGVGYNTNQSEIAVGSGGWFGKGWTEGTQTKGNFVPEQHTDYIFSTVGEEWGFVGSFLVVLLFVLLILRILHLAEKQKSTFNRVYGYSVASILFIHFFVTAARALGFNDSRIISKHIIPNVLAPVIVISAANFAGAILIESGLSFLGIGAQPPMPSWGAMIKDHYSYIILGKAYLAVIPGLAIMSLVMAFMLIGNALRDALDVKD